ncbi:MAG: tRNA (5-methylaminomethyl-2-thiouridine)(34)-methyltransferase MnmD [Bacteroidales bacterium]|jgi:tRNA U34 5-methylaminomethyl-2-thiouridine-forming methyltransferase MnmC|nr:tRNA (5-methylaminomethyl-2-thiouridine)(34)-methyltransferase MnmD [Bacteroidales bacterium]
MNKEIIITKTLDGSKTIKNSEIDEYYHSTNGAIQESLHVFIKNGLCNIDKEKIKVLEIGFGTGLNAMLTYIYAEKNNKEVDYTGIELFPLDENIFSQLNYAELLNVDSKKYFFSLHICEWNKKQKLNESFIFTKYEIDVKDYQEEKCFDVIYFDAFSPDKQNYMWTETILKKMYSLVAVGGIFVTYCSKGEVKRNLRSVGFTVKRLQGAAGKHHMVIGVKS